MGMVIVVKFDTKKMLEHVLVAASLECGTKTICGNNSVAAQGWFVHPMPVDEVLDENTLFRWNLWGRLGGSEPYILVLKSLGIPTPRNPHYQVLAISICLSPHIFQVTDYLANLNFCSNTLHTTTTIE
jgi:hypothetical protein